MTSEAKQNRPGVVSHRRPAGRPSSQSQSGEHGFVLVFSSMLLVVLMMFAAFAVDLGSWYSRAAQLQRGADAGALAGVVWMPNDFAKATTEARDAAAKNGLVHGQNSITISVTRVPNRPQQLKVTISDSNVETYFGKIALDHISLQRTAVAEFVLPVPLGSPENYFGNDPVTPPIGGQPGLWGNIHGPQTDNNKGDQYAAGCRNVTGCSTKTSEYRGSYLYAIDVPAGGTSGLQVEIYDAGMYHRLNEQTETGDTRYSTTYDEMTTTWEMYYRDNTPLDAADNIANNSMATGPTRCSSYTGKFTLAQEAQASTYKNKWVPICRIGAAPEGRYYLRVSTSGDGDAANRYSIRVKPASGAGKPRLSAYDDMSMFNNQLAVNPAFYLAQVEPLHKGKRLIVNLYDPGEINVPNATMQIQKPNATGTGVATAATCTLSVYNNPTDTTPASTTTISPCSVRTTNGSGGALYNGKMLKIEVKLDNTYSCATCWWKVRYDLAGATSGSPSDTTTWSAVITGDPVRLTS